MGETSLTKLSISLNQNKTDKYKKMNDFFSVTNAIQKRSNAKLKEAR